jgi:nucleotide-binding universal stress UspA family protein
MSFKKILCPVDFSEPSRHTMRVALDLARESGASMTLFHVYQFPAFLFGGGVMVPPNMMQDLANDAEKELARWRAEAETLGPAPLRAAGQLQIDRMDRGPAPELHVLREAPLPGLVRRLETGNYDLVALGSHGRRGLRRFVLGSVAEAVAHRAPCSVLVAHLAAAGD